MRKFSILFILISFSLILISSPVDSQSNVCCALATTGDYCVFTDSSNCASDVPSQVGFVQTPFSCSNVDSCKPVWCLNNDGTCSQSVSQAQCIAQSGAPIKSSESGDVPAQCQKGACIIGGQCNYPIGRNLCKSTAEELNIPFEFDTSVKSLQECRAKFSRDEGCCISGNTCTRTIGSECSGEFQAGYLCSNDQLAGKCTAQKEWEKVCGVDGEDVYWKDSLGNLENVVGVPSDGLIHDSPADKKGKVGDCDITRSTVCGINPAGENACVSISCNAGGSFVVNQYDPGQGKVIPQSVPITSVLLGGEGKRENGESWCVAPDVLSGIEETSYSEDNKFAIISDGNSPGSRHYVYSCVYGKIEVNACGVFRDEICRQKEKSGKTGASCIKNEWQQCRELGKAILENECKESEFCVVHSDTARNIGKVALTGGVGLLVGHRSLFECEPRFPPGLEHTELETLRAPQDHTVENTCGTCGDGYFNTCDDSECQRAGDCNYKGPNILKNVIIGGVIGAAVGATAEFGFGIGSDHAFIKDLFGKTVTKKIKEKAQDAAIGVAANKGAAALDQDSEEEESSEEVEEEDEEFDYMKFI